MRYLTGRRCHHAPISDVSWVYRSAPAPSKSAKVPNRLCARVCRTIGAAQAASAAEGMTLTWTMRVCRAKGYCGRGAKGENAPGRPIKLDNARITQDGE